METSWVAIIVSIAVAVTSAVLSYGKIQATVQALRESCAKEQGRHDSEVSKLQASRDKLGERIGRLEQSIVRLQEREAYGRSISSVSGVPVARHDDDNSR